MSKSKSLKTTGSVSVATRQPRSIGLELGATGSGELLNTPHPRELDEELLTSLPQSVQSALVSTVNRDYELTGYKLSQQVPAADLDTAKRILLTGLEPLPPQTILQELTKLKVKTKTRNMTTDEQTLMIQAYCEELQRFPADIVLYVLRSIGDTSPWFPAWAELHQELRWRTDKRAFMLDALNRGAEQMPSQIQEIVSQSLKRERKI